MKRLLLLLVLLATGVAHAQTPISALPAATTSTTGVEPFPVVQAGTTKKMTLAQVVAFLNGASNLWTGVNTFSATTNFAAITATNLTLTGQLTNGMFSTNITAEEVFDGGPGTTGSTGASCGFLYNSVPNYSNWCITDPANTTFLNNKPSGAIIVFNGFVPICFGNVNADLCISDSGITTPTATTPVPWPKVAYGSINGTSGCVLDAQVATAGISGCTFLGTAGNYLVSFSASAGFTMPPACTIAVGSGSSGGSNAASVQSVTTALSGSTYVATILAFTPGITSQNNHFMITCMGQ